MLDGMIGINFKHIPEHPEHVASVMMMEFDICCFLIHCYMYSKMQRMYCNVRQFVFHEKSFQNDDLILWNFSQSLDYFTSKRHWRKICHRSIALCKFLV